MGEQLRRAGRESSFRREQAEWLRPCSSCASPAGLHTPVPKQDSTCSGTSLFSLNAAYDSTLMLSFFFGSADKDGPASGESIFPSSQEGASLAMCFYGTAAEAVVESAACRTCLFKVVAIASTSSHAPKRSALPCAPTS